MQSNDFWGVSDEGTGEQLHVNTSPSSSQESDLEWAHPRPPGPERKWEEEEEREVAGSQRETECGEIGRGTARYWRSKTKVMDESGQNKHDSGGAFRLKVIIFRFLIWDVAALLFSRNVSGSFGHFNLDKTTVSILLGPMSESADHREPWSISSEKIVAHQSLTGGDREPSSQFSVSRHTRHRDYVIVISQGCLQLTYPTEPGSLV